jgi:hypothetical protein
MTTRVAVARRRGVTLIAVAMVTAALLMFGK